MSVHWEQTGVPRTASIPSAAIGVAATLDTLSTVMASLAMVHNHATFPIMPISLCKINITQKLMNVRPISQTPVSRGAATLPATTLVNAMMDSG